MHRQPRDWNGTENGQASPRKFLACLIQDNNKASCHCNFSSFLGKCLHLCLLFFYIIYLYSFGSNEQIWVCSWKGIKAWKELGEVRGYNCLHGLFLTFNACGQKVQFPVGAGNTQNISRTIASAHGSQQGRWSCAASLAFVPGCIHNGSSGDHHFVWR